MTGEPLLMEALRQVIDPELGMNIVDLGLVYRLETGSDGVQLDITMTSPACPMAEQIMGDAEDALAACLPPSMPVQVNLVWEPIWTPARMTERARQAFGWDASTSLEFLSQSLPTHTE